VSERAPHRHVVISQVLATGRIRNCSVMALDCSELEPERGLRGSADDDA
jgi:hypothetical protein